MIVECRAGADGFPVVLAAHLIVLGSEVGSDGHLVLLSIVVIVLADLRSIRPRALSACMQIGQAWLRLERLFIVEKDRVADWTVVPPALQRRQITQQTRLI